MSEQLTSAQLMDLIGSGGPFSTGSTVDPREMIEVVTELLRQFGHPDYVTVMASHSVSNEYAGVEGFREAWSDWLSPYESFRFDVDEVIRLEDRLVFSVRQVATTRHNGVEVETSSASVWWFEKGQVRQAAFYLDRQAGLKAAGLDPGRQSGD
jgi:ketosteroid isomerase-like protein